ncbi:hypothetical protein Q4Q35_10810 [Flavivirga aquimarina]|uniref:Chromosome partition protein Smc n=1 Tax=Flavivirga aquimarina TaxID=2027862 RepID=A0ABT8WAX0_9FLAO|nr:hypothetical protein [Flavivirga aquimarina]MDO5970296.1 hypothetical protein [Flavivirga aquimarina]
MGIRKSFIICFPLLLCCILSCNSETQIDKENGQSKELDELKTENEKLKEHLKFQEKNFNSWLNTFSEIQKEFLSIETEEFLYSTEEFDDEGLLYEEDYISEFKNKISNIKLLLDKKDKELSEYVTKYEGLKEVLYGYRRQLNNAKRKIDDLENENDKLEFNNRNLSSENEELYKDLDNKKEDIETLENDIEDLSLKLNERYLIEIAKIDSKISKIYGSKIDFYYNLDKYEVLTFHPKNSYAFYNVGNQASLSILNAKDFWSLSKFLVIRTKKRKLN